jgi:hypothetical protein
MAKSPAQGYSAFYKNATVRQTPGSRGTAPNQEPNSRRGEPTMSVPENSNSAPNFRGGARSQPISDEDERKAAIKRRLRGATSKIIRKGRRA